MHKPYQIGLILYPDVSPFHFATPYMVFSHCQENGLPLCEIKIIATPQVLAQQSHFSIKTDGDLSLLDECDMAVMCGWHDIATPPEPDLIHALKRFCGQGKRLVGLCYGAYVLAYAGLLDDKRATTHWYQNDVFKRLFPKVHLDENALYIEDDNIMTSAGTVAGLDCCLAIVRSLFGGKIANHVARLLVVSPHREGGQAQYIEQPVYQHHHQAMAKLLDDIRQNLAKDYPIDTLAQQMNMSRSTFTRHFRRATGQSFHDWLIHVRVQQGRELLEGTPLSVEQIAEQVGFGTAVAFREQFKKIYHVSPMAYRRQFDFTTQTDSTISHPIGQNPPYCA